MIDFEKIQGPFDVPVYFQHLPVNTVSISWLVFVGSADDDLVGDHGIYHWFEHMPSRGTHKFPGGYRDTEARLVRHGGCSDAETGHTHTGFSADVPRRVWDQAMDVLADMVARPLFRIEDIEAEREVILQEIDEWHSSPYTHSLCQLPGILWPGHPLGHDQLGTHETLAAIDPLLLSDAHQLGYARNRCVLFISGNLKHNELLDVIAPCLERMPDRDIPARRAPARYGALPKWKAGQTTTIQTQHDESVVYLLFPLPPFSDDLATALRWDFIEEVFSAGALGSPLNRLVREDSQLAYSPEMISGSHPDGGYIGLVAQTSVQPERVLDAFWQLITGPELRSPQWLEYVRDTIRGTLEMNDPDASGYTQAGTASLIHYGQCLSDHQYAKAILSYSDRETIEWLDQLTPKMAHSVVFQAASDSTPKAWRTH